jgi:Ca2+-binding EF-hand superfamily protein
LDKNKDGKVVASEFLELLRITTGSASVTLQQAEKSMASMDKNKDGAVDEQELAIAFDGVDAATITDWCESLEWCEALNRLFRSLDKNNDGKVAASEFLEFLRVTTGRTSVMLQEAERTMAVKDKNKDGALDFRELAIAMDGVDAETITGWCESLEKSSALKRLFRSLDKNKDGKVVASEFLEFLRATTGRTSVTLQQAEKSMAFKDKNKDGALDEQELAIACDGVDAATIAEWCKSLGNRSTKPTKSPWMGWFCYNSHATSADEIQVD